MLTLTLPHTCRDTERRRSDGRTRRRPRGQSHAPLMPGQSRLSAPSPPGTGSLGLILEAARVAGRKTAGSLCPAWRLRPTSPAAWALRKQPALPYSGRVRRGRLFLRAEREGTLHPKAEKRNVPAGRQAGFRGQELAGLGFAPRGGGCSQASRAGAPAAAVLPTRSWRGGQEPAVSTLGTGEGRKKEEALR